jgi:predicted O-methyltransferase YrrM
MDNQLCRLYKCCAPLLAGALIVLTAAPDNAGAAEERTKAAVSREHGSPPSVEIPRHYAKAYEFTDDWFTWLIPVWKKMLAPFAGKPDVRYLEIGILEGRSFLWALEHVLTHPTSHATGIDISILDRMRSNVEKSGAAERVRLVEGSSKRELRRLPFDSFDIIYIDGSHAADDVLSDAVLSWELLKVGGILIFDDYEYDGSFIAEDSPMPDALVPRLSIDAFLKAYAHEIDVVHRGYQVMVRKHTNVCFHYKGFCSPVGSYTFLWGPRELVNPNTGKSVDLSDDERRKLEQLLLARTEAEALPVDPILCALRERLGKDFELAGCP